MTKTDFLDRLFEFFNKNDDNLKRIYFDAFETKKQINWMQFYFYIIKNTENGFLPKPKYFIDLFPKFEISEHGCEKDGNKVLVTFKSGRTTEFVITSWANVSLGDLVARFKNRDDVVKAELFDKNVIFFENNKIFPKDAKGKLIYSI